MPVPDTLEQDTSSSGAPIREKGGKPTARLHNRSWESLAVCHRTEQIPGQSEGAYISGTGGRATFTLPRAPDTRGPADLAPTPQRTPIRQTVAQSAGGKRGSHYDRSVRKWAAASAHLACSGQDVQRAVGSEAARKPAPDQGAGPPVLAGTKHQASSSLPEQKRLAAARGTARASSVLESQCALRA